MAEIEEEKLENDKQEPRYSYLYLDLLLLVVSLV